MCPKFVHLINPVNFPAASPLSFAQQVSLKSIHAASKRLNDQIQVEFITAQYAEDRQMIPDFFSPTPDLTRSVLDMAEFRQPRKLPLLADLLQRAYEFSDAKFLIYTNIDIAVQPHFYQSIDLLINQDKPAATITRRTISAAYQHVEELPIMYAEIGQSHRGWDTYVFPREWVPQLVLGNTCLGAPLVGLVMIANLISLDQTFREFTDLHLTFHLGNDRQWSSKASTEYFDYNRQQAALVLTSLESKYGRFKAETPPGKYLFFHRYALLGRLYDLITSRIYLPPRLTRRQP